jgi:hypothetical protein
VKFPSINEEFVEKRGIKLKTIILTELKEIIVLKANFSKNGHLRRLEFDNLEYNEIPSDNLTKGLPQKYLLSDTTGKKIELVFIHSIRPPHKIQQLTIHPVEFPNEISETYDFITEDNLPVVFEFKYSTLNSPAIPQEIRKFRGPTIKKNNREFEFKTINPYFTLPSQNKEFTATFRLVSSDKSEEIDLAINNTKTEGKYLIYLLDVPLTAPAGIYDLKISIEGANSLRSRYLIVE